MGPDRAAYCRVLFPVVALFVEGYGLNGQEALAVVRTAHPTGPRLPLGTLLRSPKPLGRGDGLGG